MTEANGPMPSISVIMPCLNADSSLSKAVDSVLRQEACLELIVIDRSSTSSCVGKLVEWACRDPRLRLYSKPGCGLADALNLGLSLVRGTLISWVNSNDRLLAGSLKRAHHALLSNPEWIMVYGEGEELIPETGLRQRYPTLPPEQNISSFRNHCFICQPTVVFRQTMAVMIGDFDTRFQACVDYDYWLRTFAEFSNRIGYIPHLQARIYLDLVNTSDVDQWRQSTIETITLLSRHFPQPPISLLHNYALRLQASLSGANEPNSQQSLTTLGKNLDQLIAEAKDLISEDALTEFKTTWLLNKASASSQLEAESKTAECQLHQQIPVQLLQALKPQLRIDAFGPPAGPHLRLAQAISSHRITFPLLTRNECGTKTANDLHDESESLAKHFSDRPFGVNLVGHAFEMFGIGEDIRMAAKALESANIPFSVIYHPAENGSSCNDRSLEPFINDDPSGGPYAFNLICMAAPIQARWLLRGGVAPLINRYTIAAWPWETQQWPTAWEPMLQVVDEVWPSSQFTAKALLEPARSQNLPIQVMPMAAEITSQINFSDDEVRRQTRQRFALPQDAVLFGYGFDINSTAIRKNPMAALEAFQLAFPIDTPQSAPPAGVALMIKAFPPSRFNPEWEWLKCRAAEDRRIHIVVGHLDRADILALYGCCDVFVSLHRSEGFGRGIAEALQLGLDVVATDYGGNVDFCSGPMAHPVRYSISPIPAGGYPCGDGHSWAEPDIGHAAELMRAIADKRGNNPMADSEKTKTMTSYRDQFSAQTTGKHYRNRLEAIWQKREQLNQVLQKKHEALAKSCGYKLNK